jgi:hypothetical protein
MFLTSRAAARQMIREGSGVILVFGGVLLAAMITHHRIQSTDTT